MPTGIAERRYTPSASLTSLRVKPVVALLAVTVAPGTAAPCWSTTRPVMVPLAPCAITDAHVSSRIVAAPNKYLLIHASRLFTNQRCSMQDADRYRSVSAIGTPEFTF